MNHRTSPASALTFLVVGGAWCCTNQDETLFSRDAGVLGEQAEGEDHGGADAGAVPQTGAAGAGNVEPDEPSSAGDHSGSGAPETASDDTPGDGLAGVDLPDAGVVSGCTGCVRLAGSGDYADYQLQLVTTWNLTASVITWRVRVRNLAGEVSAVPYVQSGDASTDEARLPVQTLTAAQDWQELSLDLRVRDGGVGAAGLESGASFDGTRVRRVGIAFDRTGAAASTIELDSVTFADIPALSASFSSDQGGFKLVESPSVNATLVPE